MPSVRETCEVQQNASATTSSSTGAWCLRGVSAPCAHHALHFAFFCSHTHVCLVSAWSDGPDHADSLSTTCVPRTAAVGRIFGLWKPVTLVCNCTLPPRAAGFRKRGWLLPPRKMPAKEKHPSFPQTLHTQKGNSVDYSAACLQSIPTCVGPKTITATMEMTSIALEKKRCFLHATQSTHFTIIPFIVDINHLSNIHPHLALNTKLG